MVNSTRFHIRIDKKNGTHTTITLFANGGNCGSLVLRHDEVNDLTGALAKGLRTAEHKLELTGELPFRDNNEITRTLYGE